MVPGNGSDIAVSFLKKKRVKLHLLNGIFNRIGLKKPYKMLAVEVL